MNGIIDVLLINIVTIMIGGVLVLIYKALEHCCGSVFQLTFYYRFLCVVLLLYSAPVLFVLFRICYHIGVRPATALLGVPTPAIRSIFLLLAAVWLIGMVVQYLKQRKGIKLLFEIYQTRIPAPPHYQKLFDEVRKEMGIRRRISLYQNYRAGTVFISGVIRPAVYLPLEEIDTSVLRVIFTHELQHYKQGDVLFKFIGVILNIVYWFWPPFSYISKEYSIFAEANNDKYCSEKIGDGRKYYYILVDFSDVPDNGMSTIVSAWNEEGNEIVRRAELVNTYKAEKTKLSLAALFVALTLVTSTATAYGATSAIQYGYDQVWNATMVGEQEELIPVPELEEYEGSVADLEGLTVVEEEETGVVGRSGQHVIDCKLMNQSYYRSSLVSKSKGGSIRVTVDVEPTNKEVTVGIIKPDGTTTFVKGKGTVAHTFSISATGNYQVFISNYSGAQVTIYGYYK